MPSPAQAATAGWNVLWCIGDSRISQLDLCLTACTGSALNDFAPARARGLALAPAACSGLALNDSTEQRNEFCQDDGGGTPDNSVTAVDDWSRPQLARE
ncbi:MAG: hypothetical protein R3C56_33115 [Pirellulaceae bacterium]